MAARSRANREGAKSRSWAVRSRGVERESEDSDIKHRRRVFETASVRQVREAQRARKAQVVLRAVFACPWLLSDVDERRLSARQRYLLIVGVRGSYEREHAGEDDGEEHDGAVSHCAGRIEDKYLAS